jgi:RsiW-degrading membrane proteinase PrsW (M82 family)
LEVAFLLFAALPVLVVAIAGDWDKTYAICCGVGAAVASLGVETTVNDILLTHDLKVGVGLKTFALTGLVEELLKYLSLAWFIGLSQGGRTVVSRSVFCAIGFACTENFLYTSGFWHTLDNTDVSKLLSLLRFFMPFMLHVTAGPILVSGHCIKGFRPVAGLVLASIYHGTYDFILATPWHDAQRIAYILIVGGLVTSAIIFRKARDANGGL